MSPDTDTNPWRSKWRAANPGKEAEYSRTYRECHPGRASENTRRWIENNPESASAAWRKQYQRGRRFRQYGVTAEWYRDQLVGQAGRCAICGSVFKSDKDTHIDHDHATGEVRGLLCANCNRLLGAAKESPEVLVHAISYLERSTIHDVPRS